MTDISIDAMAIKKAEEEMIKKLAQKRDSAYQRVPLLFTLLATFGIVATFYGFEHIIDNIPFLANNPIILMTVGVGTLYVTGQLYKRLG